MECRRRCCLCVYLDQDKSEKEGQIAHIDKDNSNNKKSNLAFLCFRHHNKYDSQTSQSKNYTQKELGAYRDQLIALIKSDPAFLDNPVNPNAGTTTDWDQIKANLLEAKDLEIETLRKVIKAKDQLEESLNKQLQNLLDEKQQLENQVDARSAKVIPSSQCPSKFCLRSPRNTLPAKTPKLALHIPVKHIYPFFCIPDLFSLSLPT